MPGVYSLTKDMSDFSLLVLVPVSNRNRASATAKTVGLSFTSILSIVTKESVLNQDCARSPAGLFAMKPNAQW